MADTKIVVIGHNLEQRNAIQTYLASQAADVIMVDSIEEARQLLGETPPQSHSDEPFIIEAPDHYMEYGEYKDGQQKRRERRAKERRNN